MTQLLVSVRNATEATAALEGGAAIIDVKEPSRGALGCADRETISEVVNVVAGRAPISVAGGELFAARTLPTTDPAVSFIKLGPSGMPLLRPWRVALDEVECAVRNHSKARTVVVAYADWKRAQSPRPYDVMKAAVDGRFAACLIDTWQKDGTSLLDWMTVDELEEFCRQCHEANVRSVVAGSLKKEQIIRVLPVNPDYIGVRGSACIGNNRLATIDAQRVADLVTLLSLPC